MWILEEPVLKVEQDQGEPKKEQPGSSKMADLKEESWQQDRERIQKNRYTQTPPFDQMPNLSVWGSWKSNLMKKDMAIQTEFTEHSVFQFGECKEEKTEKTKIPVKLRNFNKKAEEEFQEQKLDDRMEQAKLEAKAREHLPAIGRLLKNPSAPSMRMTELIKKQLTIFSSHRETPIEDLKEADLLVFLATFAFSRGRCIYQTGAKGISPATARKYTFALQKILKKQFGAEFEDLWPNFKYIPSYWARDLSKELLYKRKHADYWTTDQLRKCLGLCQEIQTEKVGSATAYYATMALPVLSITITQSGARTGELLETRPEQVVIGEVDGKIAVAIFATGSKMDPDNQKSAPISFMQLKDREICPVSWFMKWLKFRNFTYTEQGLKGRDKFVFAGFSSKGTARIQTSQFTKQVSY